jgi:hypothetical protein
MADRWHCAIHRTGHNKYIYLFYDEGYEHII